MLYRHLTLNIDDSNSSPYTRYNHIFIELTYKNQYIYLAQNGSLKKAGHPGAIEQHSYILNFSDTAPDFVNPKSGIAVPENLIKEWSQVFIDTLKEDPFFKKFIDSPAAPTDSSGSTSALAALKGKSGVDTTQLMVNGISGSHVDLGLPMFVQLKGSVDQSKATTGMTGLVAYKVGNSVFLGGSIICKPWNWI